MTKEIAFFIWLYDKELKSIAEGNNIEAFEIAEIRERFADVFGINYLISELYLELSMDK